MNARVDVKSATTEQLLARFEHIAIAQEETFLDDRTAIYNKLFDEMLRIAVELKRRGPEALRGLASLYSHSSAQVRLKAAIYSLGIDPVGARKTLETLAAENAYPPTADARIMLKAYDSGQFVPI